MSLVCLAFCSQIMVCKAGEKAQVCVVQFNMPFEANHKVCTSDKFSLYVSTRVKELFNYIEEHYHMQPDSFKLLLSTSSCAMVILITFFKYIVLHIISNRKRVLM